MAEDLKKYFQQCLAQGRSREDIVKNCLNVGWSQELVDQTIKELNASSYPTQENNPQGNKETWKIKIVALWFVLGGALAFLVALGSFVGGYLSTRLPAGADSPIHPIVLIISGLLMLSLGILSFKISGALHRLDKSGYLSALMYLGTVTASSFVFAIISFFLYREISELVFGVTSVLINGLFLKLLISDKTQFSLVESNPNLKKITIVNYFFLLCLTPFFLLGKNLYVSSPSIPEFDQGKIIFSAFKGSRTEPCSQIYELNLKNEKTTLITDNGGGFAVSPDETKMIYRDGGSCAGTYEDRKNRKVYLYDFNNQQSKELIQVINGRNFIWNSNSQKFLYAKSENLNIFNIDIQANDSIVQKAELFLNYDWLDTNQVIFNQRLTEINRVDITNHQINKITDGTEIAVSPDNRTAAIVRMETNKIFLIDLNTPSEGKRLTNLPGDVKESKPTWSSDGTLIAFESHRKLELSNIAIIDIEAQEIQFQSSEGGVKPSWSPSGKYLVYFSGKDTIHLISANGDFHRKIITDKGTMHNIAWITKVTK